MAVRFVAVGDVLVDVVATGRDHDARVRVAAGGSGSNAAVAAVRAGAGAELYGRVGDDAGGRMVRAELTASGVVASLSVDAVQPTGTFLVVDGEVRADRGANAGFVSEHLPARFAADAALVSGHLQPETVAAALERSDAPWTGLTAGRLRDLPGSGHAVFLDDVEAHALTGLEPGPAARELGRRYRLACVTRGADGVVATLDGSDEVVAAPSIIEAGDSVGAGDAFAAVTLVALARGEAFRDALVAGCRAGALALSLPK